jgi:hypothetical protein
MSCKSLLLLDSLRLAVTGHKAQWRLLAAITTVATQIFPAASYWPMPRPLPVPPNAPPSQSPLMLLALLLTLHCNRG